MASAICTNLPPSALSLQSVSTVLDNCTARIKTVIERFQNEIQDRILSKKREDFQLLTQQELTQEPIPTHSKFEIWDMELAHQYRELVQTLTKKALYREALDRSIDALRHTRAAIDHASIPSLYERLNEPEKARLSRLYLGLYQMEERKIQEAIDSFEECDPKDLQLDPLLAILALQLNPSQEKIAHALSIASQQLDDDSKRFLYTQIITLIPNHLITYKELIPLVKEFDKKNDLLFKAASLTRGTPEASQFLSQTVMTSVMWENAKNLQLPPYPDALTKFLAEDCSIWKGKKRHETHIVIPLFPKVSIDGEDPIPLNLESLLKLADRSYAQGKIRKSDSVPSDVKVEQPFHYAVMTSDIIPDSQLQSYEGQRQALPLGYEPPHILDATIAILWDAARSGKTSYGSSLGTFTNCQETTQQGSRFCVAGHGMAALSILEDGEAKQTSSKMAIGMAGWRKF